MALQDRLFINYLARRPFSILIEKNKPFYALNVYAEMIKIREIIHREAIEFQYGGPNPTAGYWTKAQENRKEILSLIDSTCDEIRNRLASISISN